MNLYLILIGLISAVSCALIIICINKPPRTTSLPTDGSKSPIKPQGLTQTQKSHLLMIVLMIFFLSMVTTNIKSSKFTAMFNNLMSFTEKSPASKVIDLRKVFYGSKGNCEFPVNKHQYPVLFEYLHEGKMEQRFLDKLLEKNFDKQFFDKDDDYSNEEENLSQSQSQLIILTSNRHNLGAQITLPWMSSKLCKSGHNQIPLIYLNLSSSISIQEKFENVFNLKKYESLKQSLCRLNGIHITKEIEKIGDYYVERQTFFQSDNKKKSQRQNAYLVIDNFQFISDMLIFNQNVFLTSNQDVDQKKREKNQQLHALPQSLGPQYQLFIDKLLTDLIQNCKINAILHSNDHKEVTKFYTYWKMFNQYSALPSQNHKNTFNVENFPFQVKNWKGLNKLEFYEILKSIILESSKTKGKEDLVWKVFESSFGKVSISSRKVISSQKEQTLKVQNNEEILISEIQHFFVKLTEELDRQPTKQTVIKIKETKIVDIRQKIAEYYGLGQAYQSAKSLSIQEKGISIGTLLRKTTMEDITKLQKLELLYIKQGKVFLVTQP